jgi:hypothetical protein
MAQVNALQAGIELLGLLQPNRNSKFQLEWLIKIARK